MQEECAIECFETASDPPCRLEVKVVKLTVFEFSRTSCGLGVFSEHILFFPINQVHSPGFQPALAVSGQCLRESVLPAPPPTHTELSRSSPPPPPSRERHHHQCAVTTVSLQST